MRRRRRKRSKQACEVEHFQKRCLERVGRIISQRKLKDMMHEGSLRFIERQSNRVSLFLLPQSSGNLVLFYDKQRNTFVTILTYEMYLRRRENIATKGTWT